MFKVSGTLKQLAVEEVEVSNLGLKVVFMKARSNMIPVRGVVLTPTCLQVQVLPPHLIASSPTYYSGHLEARRGEDYIQWTRRN